MQQELVVFVEAGDISASADSVVISSTDISVAIIPFSASGVNMISPADYG